MKSRILRISAATAMVFAVIFGITIFYESEPVATAQGVLTDALKAASGLNSIHMKGQMRTYQAGNFDSINLNRDFLPIEMWKRFDRKGALQWRVEKSGGTFVVMDGRTTVIFMVPNAAIKVDRPSPLGFGSEYGHDTWMGRLLDVQGLLDSELYQAKENPNRQIQLFHEENNGRDKIILEVGVQTDLSENDFLRNSIISGSDSVIEYQFDANTMLLEGFKVYVIDDGKEVLVFEITEIGYNAQIDDSVFIADLPDDVTWFVEPQPSSDDEKYSLMTPRDVAYAFFDACSKGDWDICLKFLPVSEISQKIKDHVIGLDIVSIGEPAKSEKYQVWFVPYEIRYNDGELKKHRLELIYYNNVKRYLIGAGF